MNVQLKAYTLVHGRCVSIKRIKFLEYFNFDHKLEIEKELF